MHEYFATWKKEKLNCITFFFFVIFLLHEKESVIKLHKLFAMCKKRKQRKYLSKKEKKRKGKQRSWWTRKNFMNSIEEST